VPVQAIQDIWQGLLDDKTPSFSLESDGGIAFDAPQGCRVRLDVIEIGQGCIERIFETEPFYEASVASKPDLLRLRAVTVVDRGSEGEVDDFRWLVWEVARLGEFLPRLDKQELDVVLAPARRFNYTRSSCSTSRFRGE
jgi:hypothetical protein